MRDRAIDVGMELAALRAIKEKQEMSWLEYDKDGMIGEKAGERAWLALQDCHKYQKSQGYRKLTMQDLFASLLLAVSQTRQEYTLEEEQQAPLEIVVVFSDGQKRRFSLPQNSQANEYMVNRLCKMITTTAEIYSAYLERKPLLNEILACFHFILDSERYRHRFLQEEWQTGILDIKHIWAVSREPRG